MNKHITISFLSWCLLGLLTLTFIFYFFQDISLAEEFVPNKKSYQELEQELNSYKNLHIIEAGFRTIDIIFGWNNVFSQVGHFCDNIINILDNYYVWSPIKYGTIFLCGALFTYFIFGYITDGSIFDMIEYIQSIQETAKTNEFVYVLEKDDFINDILQICNLEKSDIINQNNELIQTYKSIK